MAAKIIYWLATGLLSFAYLSGGYFDVAQPDQVILAATHLGYPLYFFTILGFWKLLAVFAILMPGLLRLKEWAYAGIFFNLTGAAATHVFVKDGVGEVMTPLIVLAIAMTSWALRPASRKLPGPVL
ncbi:MAG: DoxX family protein [Planctomycetes bacterium]|nr:DoxX family protein [Planctomycetota bacterium]